MGFPQPAQLGSLDFAAPAILFGTTALPGVATTTIRSDATLALPSSQLVLSPLQFGAKGDAVKSTSGTYSGGVNGTLSDTAVTFQQTDVGKIVVAEGTGTANTQLVGTIASVAAGVATITGGNASTPASAANLTYWYGTDDSTAISNFLNFNTNGTSSLQLAGKNYLTTAISATPTTAASTIIGPGSLVLAGAYANAPTVTLRNASIINVTLELNGGAYNGVPFGNGVILNNSVIFGLTLNNAYKTVGAGSVNFGLTFTQSANVVLSGIITGITLPAGALLENCTVTGTKVAPAVLMSGGRVLKNTITNGSAALTSAVYGIQCNAAGCVVESNIISTTGSTTQGGAAVFVAGQAKCEVLNNDLSGSVPNGTFHAVQLNAGSNQAVVDGNIVIGAGTYDALIQILGSSQCQIANNVLTSGATEAIVWSSTSNDNSIHDNIVSNAQGSASFGAIMGRGGDRNKVSGNRIILTAAGTQGIVIGDLASNSRCSVMDNHIDNASTGACTAINIFANGAANVGTVVGPNQVTNSGAGATTTNLTDNGASTVYQGDVEPISSGALPTATLSSATGAQLSTTRTVDSVTPVTFNPTAGASATCVVALSPDNVTYSNVWTETEPAGIALDGTIHGIRARVPAGWYIKLTATNATIGTTSYW